MSFKICGINPLVNDHSINLYYEDLLALSDSEFVEYVTRMRNEIRRLWDDEGIPPANGWSVQDVADDFGKLAGFPVSKFWRKDELSGRRVIHNTFTVGNSVNAWNLNQMLRTRINYTEKSDQGRSIYDFFGKDELFNKYLPYARRHFLRDSFFFFAQTVKLGDALPHRPDIRPLSAVDFVNAFNEHERPYGTHELLLEPKKIDKKYSGYAEHLVNAEFFSLTLSDLSKLTPLPKVCKRLISRKHCTDDTVFHVRMYEKRQRIFPGLYKSFRVSMCQYAVNFPPLTAKLLYDTFLRDVKGRAMVWDPSAGWAGRLLGALSSEHELRYIGTDPNPAFYDEYAETTPASVYIAIGEFYNNIRSSQSLFGEENYFDVLQSGSEVFHKHVAFRRGEFDLVFTSPPYFNREAYSDDENQSYKKFGAYESWRDGFLRPTIQNAYDALKHKRYFLWNIADVKVGKKYLPLETDSMAIAKEIGFEYKETILMTLRSMPGANRAEGEEIEEVVNTLDGEETRKRTVAASTTAKNSCKVDGRLMKCEPVHVFWKP